MDPLILGISIISLFVFVLIGFFVKGVKVGFLKSFGDLLIGAGALCGAVFLAKPVLSLLDKIANSSMLFFDNFLQKFAKIPLLNQIVDSTTYSAQVQQFESADVAMNSWLKKFLLLIFDNTTIASGETTTLGTVASMAFSHLLVLLIVSVVLFLVIRIVLKLVLARVFNSNSDDYSGLSKFFGGILTMAVGAVYCAYIFVCLTVVPVLGIDGDVLDSAVEKTKILQTPYQFVQTQAEKYLPTKIDWSAQIKGKTSVDDAFKTTYGGTCAFGEGEQKVEYTVQITILSQSEMSETLTTGGSAETKSFTFVLCNDKLYEYEIDENGNHILHATRKFDKKKKTIDYRQVIEGDGQTKNISVVLTVAKPAES